MQLAGDLGIVLSVVLGCLLLALIAELYYMLCWSPQVTAEVDDEGGGGGSGSGGGGCFGKKLLGLIRWKKKKKKKRKKKKKQTAREQRNMMESAGSGNGGVAADIETGCCSGDAMIRGFEEESVEAELKRLHNLAGPPRFLFTITEETKDDLESEGHRSKRGSRTRSLSDLMVSLDNSMFNPLFESSADLDLDLDLSRLRSSSSPPPKFKFLRDAEEKLLRGLMEEARRRTVKNGEGSDDDGGSSVVTVIVGETVEKCHSASPQVLPLSSSPSTPFIPVPPN